MREATESRDDRQYKAAKKECEIFRMAVENARATMELHRTEHGC
jgi:hypothetical protein